MYQKLVLLKSIDDHKCEVKIGSDERGNKVSKLAKVDMKDKKKKQKLWTIGLVFYTQALPFVAIANLIYFVDFATLSQKLSPSFLKKHPNFDISNQSV